MNLSNYVDAGFPILYVETFEVKRAIKDITVDEGYNKYVWNFIQGIVPDGKEYANPIGPINFALTQAENRSIIVVENYDMFLTKFEIVQNLLNAVSVLENKQIVFCIVGSEGTKFPGCIDKIITSIDFNLPTKEDFREVTKHLVEQVNLPYDEHVADSCVGLPLEQGKNAIALSIIKDEKLNKDSVLEVKRQMIKKTGFMDVLQPEPLDNQGGLFEIKKYTWKRKEAYEPGSIKPKMKAMFLAGIPGTGKSLFAKVMASIFNCPIIIIDVGAMKGGIVGDTERNTRLATKIIDSFGFCIVLIDEVEKAFGGSSGNVVDTSGVSQGQLGHFLTWMQDRKSEAILVATSNDITKLPPEFLRAGRWDALWFISYPTFEERKEIIPIMNRRHKSELPIDDDFVESLNKWTGAEIEQLAKDSHFEPIEDCMKKIPIVSIFKEQELRKTIEFGKSLRQANGVETREKEEPRRKIAFRKLEDKKKNFFDEPILDDRIKNSIKKKLKSKD